MRYSNTINGIRTCEKILFRFPYLCIPLWHWMKKEFSIHVEFDFEPHLAMNYIAVSCEVGCSIFSSTFHFFHGIVDVENNWKVNISIKHKTINIATFRWKHLKKRKPLKLKWMAIKMKKCRMSTKSFCDPTNNWSKNDKNNF